MNIERYRYVITAKKMAVYYDACYWLMPHLGSMGNLWTIFVVFINILIKFANIYFRRAYIGEVKGREYDQVYKTQTCIVRFLLLEDLLEPPLLKES
jgi:hypothetical protein